MVPIQQINQIKQNYKKFLKMRMPPPAVRNKMVQDKMSHRFEELMAYEEGRLDEARALTAQNQNAAPPAASVGAPKKDLFAGIKKGIDLKKTGNLATLK